MKLLAAALLLGMFVDTDAPLKPEPRYFHLERAVTIEARPGESGPHACAVLDGAVYAHADPSLADVRLFRRASIGAEREEIPYALTVSETAPSGDRATVVNLGVRDTGAGRAHVVFDLQMPERAYTNVNLQLRGQDFLASAAVTGMQSLGEADSKAGTSLGTFTLFDLTSQRLGRSTSLPLNESTFPYLHVDLAVEGAGKTAFAADAEMVEGAEVPPSREAQTLYTVVEQTTSIAQRGRETVATLRLPAHVPIERVSFELQAGDKTNFSRTVKVTAHALGGAKGAGEDANERDSGEEIAAEISRVNMRQAGQEIRQETLAFDATLGSNSQRDASVEIAVENGDDRPLAITGVRLEMRQRKLCFDVPAGSLEMFYGDGALVAPVYDYSRVFAPGDNVRVARLGAEQQNPEYVLRVQRRLGLLERHPEILWIALLGAMAVLAVLAFRSARHRGF